MKEIKKKQHYVWKEYLRNWAPDDKIFYISKHSPKILKGNLNSVAQQKYFYELEEFTLDEEAALEHLIRKWSSESVLEVNLKIMNFFLIYSKYKRLWKNVEFEFKEEKLRTLKTNTLENVHTMFESFGKVLVKIKDFNDLYFFKVEEERLKALIYLCIQYTRTSYMDKRVVEHFSRKDLMPKGVSKLFAITFSIQLGSNLALQYPLAITYLQNSSSLEFLTTDQPIINLKVDYIIKPNEAEELEFFYPINPRSALLISLSNVNEITTKNIKNESEVDRYNKSLSSVSKEFIFATNAELLERYM